MARFAVKTLEFDKVKALLASKTATSLGKAQALAIRTESEFSIVKRLQEETAEALRLLDEGKRFPFGGAHNIVAAVKHAQLGAVLEAETLMEIGSTAAAIRQIKTFLQEESELAPTLAAYAEALQPLPRLEKQLENAISEKGEIKDSASTKLGGLRTGIQIAKNRVREQLEKVLHDPNNQKYFQDALVTMRGDRYVIPIKQEYKLNFPGVVHDQSGSGATLFIEPMAVVNLNNDIKKYMAEEKEEIERILRQLSGSVGADGDLLTAGVETLTNLDVICARAYLAQAQKAVRPMLHLGGKVEIVQGRHPLLDQSQVVPLDIELGGNFNTLLITGPNTGGKTVSLKTVGLFTLMGQSGLQIPAFDGSELSVFDEVFADIGDEQSIEQSLSTFSAHMTNIVKILNQADSRSLCLFDELCAGTDPTEGAALAISILSFLHNMKCRTMATTHYSELKVFALSTPGVENACCEFNVETLRPTYKLLIGIPGKSNAFAISRQLGLPDYIIDDAKTHLESNDEAFEDLLANLEQSRVTIEKEREEIASYKEEISRLKKNIEQKEERLDERKEKLLKNANEEAQRILREAKETADQTIRNINKLAASSGVGKELEAERTKLREKLDKVDKSLSLKNNKGPKKTISPKKLKIGDGVKVLTMNLKGTVSTLPNAKGDLYVQMGILRSLVNIKDLELLDEASVSGPGLDPAALKRNNTGSGKIKMAKSFSVSPEVNLIGMTTDEAMPVLDKYLDDAYLAHLPQVRVVHGRGTGALRAAVHKHLKKLKYVKEFRLGEFGEGDTGVTIVTFK